MGFHLRKSVSVGPFRFNLSGSGVGMSAGVRGFRVGTGPRGNYVRIGRSGVYYQQTFSTNGGTTSPVARQAESLSCASQITDASSEQLLNEIREKRRLFPLLPLAIAGAIFLFFFAAATGSGWLMLFATFTGLAAIIFAKYQDTIRKTVVILYEFEPHVDQAFQRFHEWAQTLSTTQRAWHIGPSGERRPTTLRTATPPLIRTNVPVLSIGAGRQTLYFLPDRLLVYDAAGVGAVSYRTLAIDVTSQRVVEWGGIPSDAMVAGHTWLHAKRDGGPDRRFNNNPQVPICAYDELRFRTTSGLNEAIQLSRPGLANGFAAALRHLNECATTPHGACLQQ